ncbi:MAG TPA: hypothetical protein VFN48_07360 [Solirubrobacteraceae bacterium]|nr:hypothetical protein [Solirubrobacteraceae bacterium]
MLRRFAILAVLLSTLALPARALADAYTQVHAAYLAAGTGTLAPCEFSTTQLTQALRQAPNYSFQYQSDFTDAIQAALSARADGQCATGRARVTRAGLGAGAHLRGVDTTLPGSVTAAGSGGLPPVLLAAGGLVGVALVLTLGAWGVAALGLDPPWLRGARHSVREAEFRLSAGWEDLLDRLRR